MYLGWMIPVMLLVEVDRPVWGIIGGATIVVAVGLFDDLYELEPIVKFIGQLLAIGVAIYFDIAHRRASACRSPTSCGTCRWLRLDPASPASGWR